MIPLFEALFSAAVTGRTKRPGCLFEAGDHGLSLCFNFGMVGFSIMPNFYLLLDRFLERFSSLGREAVQSRLARLLQ
jgi:hypothetical protein